MKRKRKRIRIMSAHGTHTDGHKGRPIHPIIRWANREIILGMEGWTPRGGWYYVAGLRFMHGFWRPPYLGGRFSL